MCRFSHFDRRSRSTTTKYLSLVFVISLFIHGSSQVSTAIWLLVTNSNPCSYLQIYFAPICLHLFSGACGVALSVLSIGLTFCYRWTSFSRYFIFGLSVTVVLEIGSMITAVALNNVIEIRLSNDMAISFADTKLAIGRVNSSDKSGDMECWNDIQNTFECCGFNEYTDWCVSQTNATHCYAPNQDLMSSCSCDDKAVKTQRCSLLNNQSLYKHTCLDRVVKKVQSSYDIIIIMDIVFCLLQCVTYMVVNCLIIKLNSTSVVETYRQKPRESDTKV